LQWRGATTGVLFFCHNMGFWKQGSWGVCFTLCLFPGMERGTCGEHFPGVEP
jgi:hypothetical protein